MILPSDKDVGHVAQISSLLNKFKNSGEEHNIILTVDYGRNNIKQKTIKELQEEKSRSGRSYSVVDKENPIKCFNVSMKIEFDKSSDFHSSNKFDSVVEERVILFFTHVFSALTK